MTTSALPERAHVHDDVAAQLGVDVDRLRAELADETRTPLDVVIAQTTTPEGAAS